MKRVCLPFAALLLCVGCHTTTVREVETGVAGRVPPQVVFLVSEDPSNYEAHRTIPAFAETLQKEQGFRCKVLRVEGEKNASNIPGIEAVRDADLLVIFTRRRALPPEQLEVIKAHLKAGKPLVGIRTANHAFSAQGDIPAGYVKWWEFVPEVLGCMNHGYGQEKLGIDVSVAQGAAGHPILAGVEPLAWHSNGSLYLVKPLVDTEAKVLLTGKSGDKEEPIAWTRMAGASRVFYTSMGYPTDFDQPQFRRLLVNGMNWALGKSK